MKRDDAAGLALILGSAGMLVTMGFHPAPGSFEGIVQQRTVIVATHALALVSNAAMLFGFLGFHERLGAAAASARAGMVAFAFASIAALCAAVLNGLTAPAFAVRMVDSASRDVAEAILVYGHLLNASFARVFMVGVAVSLLLWCASILHSRALPAALAWTAGILGAAGLVVVTTGLLGTSVHDFGLFILGFAAWAIYAGVELRRRSEPATV